MLQFWSCFYGTGSNDVVHIIINVHLCDLQQVDNVNIVLALKKNTCWAIYRLDDQC